MRKELGKLISTKTCKLDLFQIIFNRVKVTKSDGIFGYRNDYIREPINSVRG